MCQRHRLRLLQVGVSRQIDPGVEGFLRTREQRSLKASEYRGDFVDFASTDQSDICCHLVVAAAPGVQLGPRRTGQFSDPPLDCRVNVLVTTTKLEGVARNLVFDLIQRAQHCVSLIGREQADVAQHSDMGTGTSDVLAKHPPIKRKRVIEGLQSFGRTVSETTVPQGFAIGHVRAPPGAGKKK
jgi:hypothetical protein